MSNEMAREYLLIMAAITRANITIAGMQAHNQHVLNVGEGGLYTEQAFADVITEQRLQYIDVVNKLAKVGS
jgi:hypothetical protein